MNGELLGQSIYSLFEPHLVALIILGPPPLFHEKKDSHPKCLDDDVKGDRVDFILIKSPFKQPGHHYSFPLTSLVLVVPLIGLGKDKISNLVDYSLFGIGIATVEYQVVTSRF